MIKVKQHYGEQFNAVKASLPGHDLPWLMQKRQAGMDFFIAQGLPVRKDEDWKYTSLCDLQQLSLEKSVYQKTKRPSVLDANWIIQYKYCGINAS